MLRSVKRKFSVNIFGSARLTGFKKLNCKMGDLFIRVVLASFVLSLSLKTSESYSIDHNSPVIYQNRTLLLRHRRQAQGQVCKTDNTKFQCATTADCIDTNLQCDGTLDCLDGTDEKESLCKNFPIKCRTPKQPPQGEWKYLTGGKGEENERVDINTVITFSCDPGYKLSTTVDEFHPVICGTNGKWSAVVFPTCEKFCPSQYNSPLITITCKNRGSIVPCDRAPNDTILTYRCAPYYERARDGKWYVYAEYGIRCFQGSWEYAPECIPVCGEKRVGVTPLKVNGLPVERGNYPWVVAIYSDKESSPYFTNICGGSLLRTDVVLTAAHCVTKKETGEIYRAEYYRVSAGKYYNQYGDARDNDTAQYAEVAEIKVNEAYKGEIQNFRGDIALLRLKTHFSLSKIVQPVCFTNVPDLLPESSGLITGWGYTTSSGKPSDVLKEIEVPFTDQRTCESELDQDFAARYLTPDKFCASFHNKSGICKGDTGSSLVFGNTHFTNRLFVHGIASVGPSIITKDQEVRCNLQAPALFTRVNKYDAWIQITLQRWKENPISGSCPALYDSPLMTLTCKTNGLIVSCDKALHNTILTYECAPYYERAHGKPESILCFNGLWEDTPECVPVLCSAQYNTSLFSVTCTHDGSIIPCDKATEKTVLTYKCLPYYERAHGKPKKIVCSRGSWDHTPECVPVCGQKTVTATPLIVNGNIIERGNYPWVVAIYSNKESSPYFTNICGGSLLRTDVVLTAAHCVTKKETGRSYPTRYYRVSVGKYYIQYEDERDNDTAQYSEVMEIKIHDEYGGELQNFRGDIALLRLKTKFSLTKSVQPVCFANLPDIPQTSGLVLGWGYTTSSGKPSDVLKDLELPFTDQTTCASELDQDFVSLYLISDKFCAGFNNKSTSVCRGDSGGGLVFRNPHYKNRFFIHGIVSLGHSYIDNQERHCNIQARTLFTKVNKYKEWIELTLQHWENIPAV